ncbi:MAG: hypothetical protein JWM56_384 [Candidatus Peribacteria bacterium]|nr:hypothetical protein [Candidatus Peribacteria bacterium]
MLRYLHQLSGFFFYVLGMSFFGAYVVLRKGAGGAWPAWWLQVADLPFIAAALLYAGISFYVSVATPGAPSRSLRLAVGLPLACLFIMFVIINFYPAFS